MRRLFLALFANPPPSTRTTLRLDTMEDRYAPALLVPPPDTPQGIGTSPSVMIRIIPPGTGHGG